MTDSPEENSLPAPVSFWSAFLFWLKLGFISFGGPAGQIAIMHEELVGRRRWISEKRFLHALNYCMLLPGPEAQQLATYLGWLMHRTWGGLVAGLLFILPSLVLLIVLSWVYIAYGDVAWVAGIFYGIKPAVTAIVFQAAYRIGKRVLNNHWLWAIAALAFIAIFALKIPFPYIVIGAGLLGYICSRWRPNLLPSAGHNSAQKNSAAKKNYGPALIDDHTPAPAHALFRWSRLIGIVIAAAVLWFIPMALLWSVNGWQHQFTQMAWFFTKAALLTFGGAYAVLPYVYQGAVIHYSWLTPTQMIDGLALGETTPGPLIMVVAYVAFVGAYVQQALGADLQFVAGATAAIIVTWFTFLPSFIFIFAGAPLIETTHQNIKFTAPLTAITAAVVGVIVNLALFFAYHIIWPEGFSGELDGLSAVIALLAAVALFRFNISVMKVIGACALIGLLVHTLML